eukprot:gene22474-28602_t
MFKYVAALRSYPELEAVFGSLDEYIREVKVLGKMSGLEGFSKIKPSLSAALKLQWQKTCERIRRTGALVTTLGGGNAETAQLQIGQILESYIMHGLVEVIYPWLCRRVDGSSIDSRFKLTNIHAVMEALCACTQSDLGIAPEFQAPQIDAVRELCTLSDAHTPVDKMLVLKRTTALVREAVDRNASRKFSAQWSSGELDFATDDLVLLLIWVIVQAFPWHRLLVVDLLYCSEFHFNSLSRSQLGYNLCHFEVAMAWFTDRSSSSQSAVLSGRDSVSPISRDEDIQSVKGGFVDKPESLVRREEVPASDELLKEEEEEVTVEGIADDLTVATISIANAVATSADVSTSSGVSLPSLAGVEALRANIEWVESALKRRSENEAAVVAERSDSPVVLDELSCSPLPSRAASVVTTISTQRLSRAEKTRQSLWPLAVVSEESNRPCVVKGLFACGTEDYYCALTAEGGVYTWGEGDCGRLGRGVACEIDSFRRLEVPRPVSRLDASSKVRQLACGKNHMMAVADSGEVFVWGDNRCGQLGLFGMSFRVSDKAANRGSGGRQSGSGVAELALASDLISVCATGPTVLAAVRAVKMTSVACGAYHSLCLSADGQVYSWGRAANGRLGQGNDMSNSAENLIGRPAPVRCRWMPKAAVSVEEVDAASVSWTDAAAVSASGRLVPPPAGTSSATAAGGPARSPSRVSHIAAGFDYSLAITECGAVYTWGCGTHGALGHGSHCDEFLPRQVFALRIPDQLFVSASASHHTLFRTLSGLLFGCGLNDCGQVGAMADSPRHVAAAFKLDRVSVLVPRPIVYSTTATREENGSQTEVAVVVDRFSHQACGAFHSAALALHPERLLLWGDCDEGEPLIDDLCIVLSVSSDTQSEETPEEYHEIEKCAVVGQTNVHAAANATIPQTYTVAYHQRAALGLCDLGYDSATLDRYPQKDYGGLELPVNELPMFAFPNDLRLTYSSLNRFPLPVFFTFVFTDQNGGHLYAACLRFYEVVPLEDLQPVFAAVYGEEQKLEILAGSQVFCPKVVCVVSKRPFYRAMRRFLRQIYSLSLSSLSCPLEYFVASLINQVPLPVEGGRAFHVMLDSALISPTSRPMAPIVFELPVARYFPHMDLDFAGPLRCLGVDHLLTVFALMLREAKLLFLCSSNTMLTDAMESLRMLLFPLTWASCFVSRLPDALGGLLEAPGGFMIGIHVNEASADQDDRRPGSGKNAAWQQSATKNFAKSLHLSHSIVAGTYIVDLSADALYQFDGKGSERLTPANVETLLKSLPLGPKLRLRAKLQRVSNEYRIGPQTVGFEEFDSAFDFQSQDDSQVTAKKWEEFPTLEIRDAFMVFLVDFLGDYPAYVIPPIEDMTVEDTYRTFREEFSVSDYLEDAGDVATKASLELLMETQMFAVLLQERSEGSHYSVVFFEQASHLLRQLGLTAGGHSSGHNPKMHANIFGNNNAIPEMPAPLFELLEAEGRWAALSRPMQQQLVNTSVLTASHSFNSKTSALMASSPAPHPHQLSMLPTSHASSISPMRGFGGGTPKPTVQAVHNEKLSDLLTMHKIMKSTDLFKRVALDDASGSQKHQLSVARLELNRNENLQLQNRDFGPLVIPGPVPHVADSLETNNGTESDDSKPDKDDANEDELAVARYSYMSGWPVFDKEVFEEAQRNIHPRLKEVRRARLFAIEKVNKRTLMFIRSPSERLAFEHEGKLRNKIRLETPREEVSAIISAVLDLASISVTLLATRVLRLSKPTADVMQMLGVVAQVESWGLLHVLDECIWRSILISCAAGGGDLMRKVACVVFEGVSSIANPDALTYGQYIQALGAKKVNTPPVKKNSTTSGVPLDQFLFLEEMGHTWFMQRSALIERALVEQDYSHNMGASGSPSNMFQKSVSSGTPKGGTVQPHSRSWGLMGHDGTPRGIEHVNHRRLVVKASTIAAHMTAEQFGLHQSSGLLSFLRPTNLIGICYPRDVGTLTAIDEASAVELSGDVQGRIEKFAEDALSITSAAAKLRRRTSVTRRRAESTASTSSLLSSISGATFPAFPSSPGKLSQSLTSVANAGSTTPSTGMMSRLYGAAKQTANSTAVSSAVASAVASTSAASSPMMDGWSKRLGSSMFGRSANNTPAKSPLPVTASADTTHSPRPSTIVEESTSSESSSATLNVLSQTLNFDDEEDDDADRDSISSRASTALSALSVVGAEPPHDTSFSEGIAALDLNCDIPETTEEHIVLLADEERKGLCLSLPNNSVDDKADSVVSEESLTKPKTVSAVDLQERVVRVLDAEFVAGGSVTGISSRTRCAVCDYSMLEEEVTALWCRYQAQDIHHQSMDKIQQQERLTAKKHAEYIGGEAGRLAASESSNMIAAHKLTCPQCATEFNPMLHVRSYHLASSGAEGEKLRENAEWSLDVSHLSPFGLRFELEELILRVGECVSDAHWLHAHRPELYWGIIWYSNRCSLPSGFTAELALSSSDLLSSSSLQKMFQNPVVVGWRDSVVRTQAYHLLTAAAVDSEGTAQSEVLQLVDLFPTCTATELDVMRVGVSDKMDGSPAGMRTAMLSLCSQCRSLFDTKTHETLTPKQKSQATARTVYITLLSLFFFFKKHLPPAIGHFAAPSASATVAASDLMKGLTKEFSFDKLYMEAIKWLLSKSDFLAMQTSELDLLSFVATRDVQAVRTGFGFHF